LKMYFNIVGHN